MEVSDNSIREFRAEVALEVKAAVGEGPVWDERRQELFFVDVLGERVHAFRPDDRFHRVFDVGRPVGAVALREDGGLVLAAGDGFLAVEADGAGLVKVGEFQVDGDQVRFNDGKVDPSGRFVAGTMHWGQTDAVGSLYMLSADGSVVSLVKEVTVSNGLAWGHDGSTLYYIDTPRHTIDAFDVDGESGNLSGRRIIAQVRDGSPDGMTIDDEGMLWVAVWGGHRVDKIDPSSGERLAVVRVPVRQVTSVAFGGPALSDLYITTARAGLDEAALGAEPHAGDLFVCRTGATGTTPSRFKAEWIGCAGS